MFEGAIFWLSNTLDPAVQLVGFYGWYGGDVSEGVENVVPPIRLQLYWKR
jgi:hypothetical protein